MIRIFLLLLLITACAEEVQETQEVQEQNEDIQYQEPVCGDCDDHDACTEDSCSSGTCIHDEIAPCCGNNICEEGETDCEDCPECIPGDCETVEFDYETQECVRRPVSPCCGNGLCEENETYELCDADCIECTTKRECYTSEFSITLQKCVEKPVTPCCGNGICDRGESCSTCDDCECKSSVDLGKFPDFLQDGTLIVVGDLAKSQDSLTASALTTKMYSEGVETEANLYMMFSSSDIKNKDMIVLGRPCENQLWEDYQGIECGSDNYFEEGTALIKLVIDDDREIVFVGGYSPEDTKKAADFLLKGSLSGMEVELDTSGSSARKI